MQWVSIHGHHTISWLVTGLCLSLTLFIFDLTIHSKKWHGGKDGERSQSAESVKNCLFLPKDSILTIRFYFA